MWLLFNCCYAPRCAFCNQCGIDIGNARPIGLHYPNSSNSIELVEYLDLLHVRGCCCCSVASGYYTERRKGVVVRMPAEQPHHRSFVEGIEQEDYNTTSEEKRNEQEIGDPIDNEIDDVTKYLRKKNPELFSFDKKYQGPTQIRRNPSSIYYYPLDHPDISVQFHPSYGDPGYGEGEYNDAFGVTGEKKNCKANATLLHAQVPGGVLPPNNSNTKSSSFSTQNRYSAIEGEGRSSDSVKDDAGNLTIGGAVDVVEASTFTKEQKTLTYNTGKYESQLFLSVIKGNETVAAAPMFDTIRSSCYRNAVPRSRNVAAKDKLMNLSIPVAEPSVEVGAVDALLEKQMKNSQNTKENIVAVIQNNQTRISTLKIGCSLNRLPVTASENNRGDVEEKSVTTAVRMDPKDGGANVSGFPLLIRVIENDFSFSNSGCTPILEATANESSSDSSYDMEHSSISDEFGERQVIRSSLQDNQQISSTSPSQSAHAEMETAANVDDNAIADTIDTTTKNIIKELLAEDNTTAFSPAPLFPPPKNVMDVTYVSSASNIGTGYPIEMAGVWLIDSLLLIRENGSGKVNILQV